MREVVKQTEGWDHPVPEARRSKWVLNFMMLEKLKGQKSYRATIPEDAVDAKMNLIMAVDATESIKMVGGWGMFRLKDG